MSPVDDIARLATAITARVMRNLADAIDAPKPDVIVTNVRVVNVDEVMKAVSDLNAEMCDPRGRHRRLMRR